MNPWVNAYIGSQRSATPGYSRWDAYLVHGTARRWGSRTCRDLVGAPGPTQEAAKWAGWAWLLLHAEEAELRYIPLPPDQVLLAERSFLDAYDFLFNHTDNSTYRLTFANFWGHVGIPAMPIELRRWVASEWWYMGLQDLESILREPGDPQ